MSGQLAKCERQHQLAGAQARQQPELLAHRLRHPHLPTAGHLAPTAIKQSAHLQLLLLLHQLAMSW